MPPGRGHSFPSASCVNAAHFRVAQHSWKGGPWPREMPNRHGTIPLANSKQTMGQGTQTNAKELKNRGSCTEGTR
ncbi:hypothetical protein BAE44_0017074 [Dichanthelium oligosanthes]|uniref:Uncharacterized protein n=1 Tax=Dichanthelium oligosanthes TaxID=888268 RepID=A0A1E5VA13_9POAL|nr:hypothetical protein BAE44_0017074 [Dichanthelium oligosanthes]